MRGWGKISVAFFEFIVPCALAACGLYTPDKDPFSSDAPVAPKNKFTKQGGYENALIDHVTCEISRALAETQKQWKELPDLYDKWGTAVTLSITVEDQSGLSPGVTLIEPLRNVVYPFPAAAGGNVTSPQSFSFSIGGTASVNGLRTETVQYTLKNSDAIAYSDCDTTGSGVLIDGDLKIKEFIFDKAQIVGAANGLWDGKTLPYNAWTEEITFVLAYGGSVTPTWKLARISANSGSNLLVAQRTNTNDLVLTLGPLKCPAPPKPVIPVFTFSQLLDSIEQGKVASLQIEGNQIHGEPTKVGKAFLTYAPNDPTRIQQLYEAASKHQVFVGPSNQQNAQACPKEGPNILVDAAMNQHQARVAASAIAVSITGQSH